MTTTQQTITARNDVIIKDTTETVSDSGRVRLSAHGSARRSYQRTPCHERRRWSTILVVVALLLALAPGLSLAARRNLALASAPNTWVPAGPMVVSRATQTATRLADGQVLIAGGETACFKFCPVVVRSAEVFDPGTGTFTLTAPMSIPRQNHTATLLPNGKVLVAGGFVGDGAAQSSAELYDPRSGTWAATGSMSTPRGNHTATLLPNGKVLVAGGCCWTAGGTASAELYDLRTGTWTPTGSLATGRYGHTATLLPNGKVLVAGGTTCLSGPPYMCSALASAELYNPRTGTWTATGSMATARAEQTATLLPNGRVLVAGGCCVAGSTDLPLASAELYDPATGTWTPTGSMTAARDFHTATLLPDGRVLVAGGDDGPGNTAELYDLRSGTWTPTSHLLVPRYQHTATLLDNGTVLVTGGFGYRSAVAVASAEVYRPGPGPLVQLSSTNLSFGYQPIAISSAPQTITITNTGMLPLIVSRVALTGTNPSDFAAMTTCMSEEVGPGDTCTIAITFTPQALATRQARMLITDNAPTNPQQVTVSGLGSGPNGWIATGSMTIARQVHTATLLPNGQILVAGGGTCAYNPCPTASAELYDPGTGTWTATGSMSTARYYHTATLLPNGQVLVAGGSGNGAELYNPATGTWTTTGPMNEARYLHTATLLPNGKVLVAGGCCAAGSVAPLASAELYDPSTGTWSLTGSMNTARQGHTATLLPNGQVLVAGGNSPTAPDGTVSAELYNPSTGTWTPTGSMTTERFAHTATLLPDGKVLVAGGCCGVNAVPFANAELYDPGTGTWTPTGSLNTARYDHTATLLPDGGVLVAGGFNSCSTCAALVSAELYNPNTGTWIRTGSMADARAGHTATLLPNGKVLVTGGASNYTPLASAELYTPGTMGPAAGSP